LEDDNFYIRKSASGENIPQEITECLINELEFFQELAELTPDDFTENLNYNEFLPVWTNSPVDIVGSYMERLKLIHRYGYGKYSQSKMFILRNDETVPVRYPDKQTLSELYGYERERKAVIDNTLALVNGKKSQNVLLYGDAGTGKSSTVKAVVNEFADMGLRLVEITKEQLREIPMLIDELSENPLKFIIFIDDLSFTVGEDCFGALKAVLEGSVSSRTDNIAIYATSNRRHLIKESFSDREGDDIHKNDTMQEMLSLSARFGLRVNFSRPDKKSYTSIAIELAKSHGINLTDDEIALKAEQFALSSGNGRSPRTANQFINQLIMEM
ncbi:MAG: ATP-binding protein, partial [Ruminococcus sp.]|nr:ATP-binding protein [Ruminococcus sp.]